MSDDPHAWAKQALANIRAKMAGLIKDDKPVAYMQSRHSELDALFVALLGELRSLSLRVQEIEARGLSYEGTFQRAQSYRRGSAVTHGGSLWIALRQVEAGETPGITHGAWQLAAKAAR